MWLKADLAANPNRCTLAYWHHPRWNSGNLGNDSSTAAFWTDLYNARADIVLNGHGNHHYERYVPQTPGRCAGRDERHTRVHRQHRRRVARHAAGDAGQPDHAPGHATTRASGS